MSPPSTVRASRHFRVLLWVILAGCQHSVMTPFPSGLEPLEDCAAPMPASAGGGAAGDLPETAKVATEQADSWLSAYVCGYIQADTDAVWGALNDPDVVTDRRRVSSYEVTAEDFEFDYDRSFRVHNVVVDILTVEYDIDWRLGRFDDGDDGGAGVAARFQKTEGSSLIELMEGSVLVGTVDVDSPGTVTFALVLHHQSPGYSLDDLQLKATDLYDSVVASAHGQPLPSY